MSSALQPNLFETTSLARLVFQQCGSYGMFPIAAIENRDFLAIAQAKMPDPMQFNTAEDFAKAYQAWSLLRKYDSFPIPLDRAAAASLGFDNSEVSCGQINAEVSALPYLSGVPLEHQYESIVELARGLIQRALGRFSMEEFQMACDFSNGASTRVPRKRGATAFKIEGKPHVTINCRDLAVHFVWCNELWRNTLQDIYGKESDPYSWFTLIPGSRFETVPKDSLTDRPICIEPDLNMFFQKGIGKMLKRRLKRQGIDLTDQTRNQTLAYIGSLFGNLATIDLSSASDSISLWLCERLLPLRWFEMLMITRSEYVLKDDKYVRLEKISSMGNGFTFELESLIFWALAKATCLVKEVSTEDLSIYGDDIICPVAAAPLLIGVLSVVGFKTNKNKTFVDGPFRESCGKHYFMGADVSPFKIESPITMWSDSYHLANQVREWGWAPQSDLELIVSKILKPIPPKDRCYVPMQFSSKSGLRCEIPPRAPVYDEDLGCHVYKFRYMAEETNEHDMSGRYSYLAGMLLREQRTASDCSELEMAIVPRPVYQLDPAGFSLEEPPVFSARTIVDENNWVLRTATTSCWSGLMA